MPKLPEEGSLRYSSPTKRSGSSNRRPGDTEMHRSSRSHGRGHDYGGDRPPERRDDSRSSPSSRRQRDSYSRKQREQELRLRDEMPKHGMEKQRHTSREIHSDGLDLVKLQEPMTPADKMAMISLQTPGMMPPSPVHNAKPKEAPQPQLITVTHTTTRRQRRAFMEAAMIEAAFSHFDVDGSGFINMQELEALAKELGQALSREELKALMREIDTDGKPDGKISLQEFRSWWMREFGYNGIFDTVRKTIARMWLKVRSAAAEPAPVGRAGVGWGGHFGWKALTTAESSLASGAVKLAVGWGDEASAAGTAQLTGEMLANTDYSAAMEALQAPGSTVLVMHVTLKLRETTTQEDLQQIQALLTTALEQHCATAAQQLALAASDLGVDVQGSAGNSPARGAGASTVSLKPRVQPTGANTDEGPEEHSLDIDIFAGGVLLESIVSTMAKAGLNFADFPTFSILCECSTSLRNLLAAGPQRILPLLALRFDMSWTVRKRLIRKLLGLLEADGALLVTLGTLLVSINTEVELSGPGELLVDAGITAGAEEPNSPGKHNGGSNGDDPDWTEVLQGLTGKRLKSWLEQLATDLGDALEGPVENHPLMTALKRFGLFVPCASLYIAGAKVEITQPEDSPLCALDQFFNPGLADIPDDAD